MIFQIDVGDSRMTEDDGSCPCLVTSEVTDSCERICRWSGGLRASGSALQVAEVDTLLQSRPKESSKMKDSQNQKESGTGEKATPLSRPMPAAV